MFLVSNFTFETIGICFLFVLFVLFCLLLFLVLVLEFTFVVADKGLCYGYCFWCLTEGNM